MCEREGILHLLARGCLLIESHLCLLSPDLSYPVSCHVLVTWPHRWFSSLSLFHLISYSGTNYSSLNFHSRFLPTLQTILHIYLLTSWNAVQAGNQVPQWYSPNLVFLPHSCHEHYNWEEAGMFLSTSRILFYLQFCSYCVFWRVLSPSSYPSTSISELLPIPNNQPKYLFS